MHAIYECACAGAKTFYLKILANYSVSWPQVLHAAHTSREALIKVGLQPGTLRIGGQAHYARADLAGAAGTGAAAGGGGAGARSQRPRQVYFLRDYADTKALVAHWSGFVKDW